MSIMSVKNLKKNIIEEPKKMGLLVGNPVYKPFRYLFLTLYEPESVLCV